MTSSFAKYIGCLRSSKRGSKYDSIIEANVTTTQTPVLQHMSSNDSNMRCRCSQPPPLPTPPREQYAVIILCQPVLSSSSRQFVFPIPKIIRSQLCSPLPCRCRRSGRGAVAARAHSHRLRRPSAASVTASWDIRAAADSICTAGRDWEMRRRQLAEAIRRACTVSANRQVLI